MAAETGVLRPTSGCAVDGPRAKRSAGSAEPPSRNAAPEAACRHLSAHHRHSRSPEGPPAAISFGHGPRNERPPTPCAFEFRQ